MRERPILFSAPMVRAILAGTKTVTRRVVKPQPVRSLPHTETLPPSPGHGLNDPIDIHHPLGWRWRDSFSSDEVGGVAALGSLFDSCPFGRAGERLWVVTLAPVAFGDGRFSVGDDGHVYRVDGAEPRRCASGANHNGYEELRLRFRGEQRGLRVNRLVCEAFYGAPKPGEVCRHLDGDRRNNRPENLDWGTPAQNQADAAAAGSFSGERGAMARLSAADVEAIRSSLEPQAKLAARYGVTQPQVSKIRSGKRWARPPVPPPPNHPRWASRITLEVTSVRVERLQEISTMDAMAEGVDALPVATGTPSYTHGFHVLWDAINGKRPGCSWSDNPWVWAINFRRLDV